MTKRHISRIAATLALLISVSGFIPVHAEPGYRYWSFWIYSEGTWSMAQEGAGTLIPKDGDVQGWRYITAPAETGPEFAPRNGASFTNVCGTEPASTGVVRVAVVIDFGDASDYPDGSTPAETTTNCVNLNEGDPSSLALSSIADVREQDGMVCGVNNLPTTGCGESVEIDTTPVLASEMKAVDAATPTDDDNRLPQLLSLILGTIVFVMAWRRMKWQKQNKQQ